MLCIIVDNRIEDAEKISRFIKNKHETITTRIFSKTEDALTYVFENNVDVVMCEQNPKKCEGLRLWSILRAMKHRVSFVLMAESDEYAIDAHSADICGYLVKPATQEKIDGIIGRILSNCKKRHIKVRTFGLFDIYVDGKLVIFKSMRAKELLAILIDHRGSAVPVSRIIAIFWPDEPESQSNKSLVRKAFMDLKKTLSAHNAEHILISSRGQKAVVVDELDCDIYRALAGEEDVLSEYCGEYMAEYAWAENTNGRLYALAEMKRGGLYGN